MNSVLPQPHIVYDGKNTFWEDTPQSFVIDTAADQKLFTSLSGLDIISSFISITKRKSYQGNSHEFVDETGDTKLTGHYDSNKSILTITSMENEKILSLELEGKPVLSRGDYPQMKRWKIFSTTSQLLGYITMHPPMVSIIQYDIRDLNNKVCLTIESQHCFSSVFTVKGNDGTKVIATIKKLAGHLCLKITTPDEVTTISKSALISLLLVMGASN